MGKRNSLSLDIDGIDGLVSSLAQFKSKSTAKRLLRGGMGKAAQALVVAVRKNTPSETGTLKKAMTKRIVSRGLSMTAVIGPDASAEGEGPDPAQSLRPVDRGAGLVEPGIVRPVARQELCLRPRFPRPSAPGEDIGTGQLDVRIRGRERQRTIDRLLGVREISLGRLYVGEPPQQVRIVGSRC